MKKKLFNLLPSFITTYKHGDKIAHSIGGLLVYLSLLIVVPSYISLIFVWIIGIGIEIYDKISKKGTPEIMDIIATVLIPTLLFMIL
jgi:hypothetical protein